MAADVEVVPMVGEAYPPGTVRIEYCSAVDGERDWALFLPGDPGRKMVVYLHGSFASADQIFTRADIRAFWLSRVMAGRHPLLSLNMRGTSYMSPAATADTHELLQWVRAEYGVTEEVLLGGSGGASSAMAYAVLHPEDVQGVVAMGMCDILARLEFARQSEASVLQELAECVFQAYGGPPEVNPEPYAARSVLAHAARLTMPIVLTMGGADPLIPVAETRKVAAALADQPTFQYHEVPGGNHDAALWVDVDLEHVRLRGEA